MQKGVFLPFPGSDDLEQLDADLIYLERSYVAPTNLTLNVDSATCHLDVRTFYWGVRKMIEAMQQTKVDGVKSWNG